MLCMHITEIFFNLADGFKENLLKFQRREKSILNLFQGNNNRRDRKLSLKIQLNIRMHHGVAGHTSKLATWETEDLIGENNHKSSMHIVHSYAHSCVR